MFGKKKAEEYKMTEAPTQIDAPEIIEQGEEIPQRLMNDLPVIEQGIIPEPNDEVAQLKQRIADIEAGKAETQSEPIAPVQPQVVPMAQPIAQPVTQAQPVVQQPKERLQVVKELPTAPVRQYTDEQGNLVHLVTVEEYLTEEANK